MESRNAAMLVVGGAPGQDLLDPTVLGQDKPGVHQHADLSLRQINSHSQAGGRARAPAARLAIVRSVPRVAGFVRRDVEAVVTAPTLWWDRF